MHIWSNHSSNVIANDMTSEHPLNPCERRPEASSQTAALCCSVLLLTCASCIQREQRPCLLHGDTEHCHIVCATLEGGPSGQLRGSARVVASRLRRQGALQHQPLQLQGRRGDGCRRRRLEGCTIREEQQREYHCDNQCCCCESVAAAAAATRPRRVALAALPRRQPSRHRAREPAATRAAMDDETRQRREKVAQ